jgi:hypothetical protein
LSSREAAVLADRLLHANEVVATTYVKNLRKALEPDRLAGEPKRQLVHAINELTH